MTISYQRTATASLLLLSEPVPESEEQPTHEKHMLVENNIKGLLPCSMLVLNGSRQYLYDITRKQSVAFLCEQGLLDFESVRTIVEGLAALPKELERFLLRRERVLLSPDCLYLDVFHRSLGCVYDLLEDGKEEGDSFEELVAFLLTKINHKDVALVNYIYRLYEDLLQPDFSLVDWVEAYYDKKQEERKKQLRDRQETVEVPENPTEGVYLPAVGNSFAEDRASYEDVQEKEYAEDTTEEDKELSLFAKLFRKTKWGKRKEKAEEHLDVFYDGSSDVISASPETVLYANLGKPDAFMQPMKLGGQPFHLVSDTNIVGKEAFADVVIDDVSVSRMHALIRYDQENHSFILEDLNSTNGTLLNGKLLVLKQKAMLKDGDMITFGSAEFRFCDYKMA